MSRRFGKSNNYPNYGFGGGANRYYDFSNDWSGGGRSGTNFSNSGSGTGRSYGSNVSGFGYANSGWASNYGQNNRSLNASGGKKRSGGRGGFGIGPGGKGDQTDDILKQLGQYFLGNFTAGNGYRYQPYQIRGYNPYSYGYNLNRRRAQARTGKKKQTAGKLSGKGKGGTADPKKKQGKKAAGKKAKRYVTGLQKYTVRNKFIEADKTVLFIFLKHLFEDIYLAEDEMHFVLSNFMTRHHNAIKLLTYECKTGLDKKFGVQNTEEVKKNKLEFLEKSKASLRENVMKLRKFKTDEKFEEKASLIDELFDVLCGVSFTKAHLPTTDDYITHKEKTKKDFLVDLQYSFLKGCYEQFHFRVHDDIKSKNNETRLAFHLNNSFIPLMIVEKVRSKKSKMKRPAMLEKYTEERKPELKEKTIKTSNMIYDKLVKNNEQVQTNLSDYIGNMHQYSTAELRDFADCLLFFDKIASVIRVKMIKYTQYYGIPQTQKTKAIDDLISKIYTECLFIIKNKILMSEKEFFDLEKDETEEEENKVKMETD